MTDVLVDWCSPQAAEWACISWHYSHSVPVVKNVNLGVWEDGEFVGAVIFSRGASPFLGDRYGLDQTKLCELARVALRDHVTPVSRIVTIAVRRLRSQSPGVRLVISFANPARGHHGGIYQAMNWIYTGLSNPVKENYVDGRWQHVRNSHHKAKLIRDVQTRTLPGKHRYLLPLDRQLRRKLEPFRLPYPAKVRDAVERSEGSPVLPGPEAGFDPRIPLEEVTT